MSIVRLYGDYSIKNIVLTMLSTNRFGIILDVDEVYNYSGILPAFTTESRMGYIYLIQSYHRGNYCLKVGKTIDLRRRMYEYATYGELRKLVGVFIVWDINLGERFIIQTFDQYYAAPHDFNNKRIGREYYLWNAYVQQCMLEQLSLMTQFVNESQ